MRGDVEIGIDDLDTRGQPDVTGLDLTGALGREVDDFGVGPVHPDHHPLDVEDDVHDILHHSGDGRELVLDAFDPDRSHRCTRDPGQQGATERVAEGVPEARLQRLDDDLGPGV